MSHVRVMDTSESRGQMTENGGGLGVTSAIVTETSQSTTREDSKSSVTNETDATNEARGENGGVCDSAAVE